MSEVRKMSAAGRESGRGGGRFSVRSGVSAFALVAALAVTACVVTPEPITEAEHAARAALDRPKLFKDQEPLHGQLGLYDAMARAIKYNLDVRMRFLLERFQETQITSANIALLPSLDYSLGYSGRNNFSGANSRSLVTGSESLEVSTSQDRNLRTADVGLTWNILDLGISYVRAKQTADRRLIVREQTRKVIHSVIRDTRAYYWQAVVAERLLPRVSAVLERAETALTQARKNEESGLTAPLEALTYRGDLLEQVNTLKELRVELAKARVRFLSTLSLPVDSKVEFADGDIDPILPEVRTGLDELEAVALVRRPELREEGYQERINQDNVRRALLQILPGIEFNVGYNLDSNSYTYANRWWDWGSTITGNLVDIFAAPLNYDTAQEGLDVVRARRLALSMAVVSQVHVSWLAYLLSRDDFKSAAEFTDVKNQILDHTRAGGAAQSQSELDVVKAEVEAMVSEIRRVNAYVATKTALGDLFVSAGAGDDALPGTLEELQATGVAKLAGLVRDMDQRWKDGEIEIPELPPVVDGGDGDDGEAGFWDRLSDWFTISGKSPAGAPAPSGAAGAPAPSGAAAGPATDSAVARTAALGRAASAPTVAAEPIVVPPPGLSGTGLPAQRFDAVVEAEAGIGGAPARP